MHIEHTALLVDDYDEAITFFVDALGFEVDEDTAATTNDGQPKRWVVVRPPGATTGLLLARADDHQRAAIGEQYAGRVGLFLRVEDFDSAHRRMCDHGVEFLSEPRDEPYGRVAVFVDVVGNRWDLLGPRP
jgi:catechol 2,3-dioxygenase-like lactoylglutathione lyase family enzyme